MIPWFISFPSIPMTKQALHQEETACVSSPCCSTTALSKELETPALCDVTWGQWLPQALHKLTAASTPGLLWRRILTVVREGCLGLASAAFWLSPLTRNPFLLFPGLSECNGFSQFKTHPFYSLLFVLFSWVPSCSPTESSGFCFLVPTL